MDALVRDMVQDEPGMRPTMDQVLERFESIRKGLTSTKLRARIADIDEGVLTALLRDLSHFGRRIKYTIRGLPAIPTR